MREEKQARLNTITCMFSGMEGFRACSNCFSTEPIRSVHLLTTRQKQDNNDEADEETDYHKNCVRSLLVWTPPRGAKGDTRFILCGKASHRGTGKRI